MVAHARFLLHESISSKGVGKLSVANYEVEEQVWLKEIITAAQVIPMFQIRKPHRKLWLGESEFKEWREEIKKKQIIFQWSLKRQSRGGQVRGIFYMIPMERHFL